MVWKIATLVLLFATDFGFCIFMRSVEVPKYQTVGSRARFRCNYELEDDKLYSIKWYKDGSEFYRYVPKDTPPSQVFDVPHVYVEPSLSNKNEVFIQDVSLGSSGLYTCEASSEAPRFKTVDGQGDMKVIDLPDTKPVITGENPNGYRVGDWMDVNCTSPNSLPPAQLKWYINREMPDSDYLITSFPLKSQSGLYTSNLRLRFKLKRNHFLQGHVTVKCTATIYTEYFESAFLYLPGLNLGEKALARRPNLACSTNPSMMLLMFLLRMISLLC